MGIDKLQAFRADLATLAGMTTNKCFDTLSEILYKEREHCRAKLAEMETERDDLQSTCRTLNRGVGVLEEQLSEHGQRWEEQRDEIDGLRAEADLMRRWLDDFEAETRALPAQHEHKGRGASSYNWRMWFVGLARAAYIRAQGESAD